MKRNQNTDVEWFIKEWDTNIGNRINENIALNQYDDWRINHHGNKSSFDWILFTYGSPHYENSLEEGIRLLVLTINEKLNFITYDSCQGHENAKTRRVWILPRNATEFNAIMSMFSKIKASINLRYEALGYMDVVQENLFDLKTNTNFPVINLNIDSYFYKRIGHEFLHTKILDLITKAIISSIH